MQRVLLSIIFVLLVAGSGWSEKVPIYTEGGVIWVEQDGGLNGATTKDILQDAEIELNTAKRTYPEADEAKVANVPADTNAALAGKVGATGDESIAGVKEFSSSPVVPTPVLSGDAANKGYVDSMTVGTAETAENSLLLEGQPASAFAPALGIDDYYVSGVEKAALPFMVLNNVENYFTATQYFPAGAVVSVASMNLTTLADFLINNEQVVDAAATIFDTDKILPASEVRSEFADVRLELETIINSSGALAISQQAADPATVGVGELIASKASGDLFYGSADSIYVFPGTRTDRSGTTYYTLTITDPGNGDVISSNDIDLSLPIDCGDSATACTASVAANASITGLTATPASGRAFTGWTGAVTGIQNPTTTALVMDGNKTVGASFGTDSGSGVLFDIDWGGTLAEDLSGGWTIDQPAGTLTTDYTPPIDTGVENFYARNNGSGFNSIYSPIVSPNSNIYYYFPWQTTSILAGSFHGIAFYSEGNFLGRTYLSSGNYGPSHGSVLSATYPVEVGVTYYNCGKFSAGTTGTDGVHKVRVGTSTDASVNTLITVNTGTSIGNIDQVRLGQYSGIGLIAGRFIVSTEPIAQCVGAGL